MEIKNQNLSFCFKTVRMSWFSTKSVDEEIPQLIIKNLKYCVGTSRVNRKEYPTCTEE
jgi:hypothetical protein